MDVRRAGYDGCGRLMRKRKAEEQVVDAQNERLSKRLSLLNLERNGNKLYVPVETGQLPQAQPSPTIDPSSSTSPPQTKPTKLPGGRQIDEDTMQLDNTAHKVYIYNLDDELSSSDAESSSDESSPSSRRSSQNRISFHPDLKAHLLATRIPQSVKVNNDGELAGVNVSNELVLYNVPASLTVPENRDSVRKAIIETRARARESQRREREAARVAPVRDLALNGNTTGGYGVSSGSPPRPSWSLNGVGDVSGYGVPATPEVAEEQDVDAMDID